HPGQGGAGGSDRCRAGRALPGATGLRRARQRDAARDRTASGEAHSQCGRQRPAALRPLHDPDIGRAPGAASAGKIRQRGCAVTLTAIAPYLPVVPFLLFAVRRLMSYLHIFQQEEYDGSRFLPWLVRTRSIDRKLSVAIIVLGIAELAAQRLAF